MKRLFNYESNYLSRLSRLLLLLSPFTVDSRAGQERANVKARAFDVEVILASERVRFRVSEGVIALRLEVLNEARELVYDSGEVTRPELFWGMKNTDDKPLQGGLYAYTLTVKRAEGESGMKSVGHLIVEQTGGRVWLTSQDSIGIDGEMNGAVIRGDSEGVVAGVRTNPFQTAAHGPVPETRRIRSHYRRKAMPMAVKA
jgi:hypothetical protein